MQFGGQAPQGQYTSESPKDIEAPVKRLEIPEKADANSGRAPSYTLKRQPAISRSPKRKESSLLFVGFQQKVHVTATNPASELISER